MAIEFTKHQQQAIDVSGGNILVSAAAGSGKTAVLTQRVMKLLTGEGTEPVMADRIVVVTFTVAAAAEMKSRISSALSEKISANPTDEMLQAQQILLNSAHISTIHSLCSSLIKENFQSLALPESIKIGDGAQLSVLQSDAINEVFEKHFEEDDSDFLSLLEFVYGKDDKKLFEMVKSIYEFIRSFAFPLDFLDVSFKKLELASSIYDSCWSNEVFNHVGDAFLHCAALMSEAVRKIKDEPEIYEKYSPCFLDELYCYSEVAQLCKEKKYEAATRRATGYERGRLSSVRNAENKELLEEVKALRASSSKIADDIVSRFLSFSQEDFEADNSVLKRQMKTLFSVITEVYELIEEKKREQEILDFSDLEHYTLKLLSKKTEDGYKKTEIGQSLSEQYDIIMIDECQDINEVQGLIFKLLSREETNLYMVGDIKQSIYSFRDARPDLFAQKKKSFPEYSPKTHDKNKSGCITLEKNFRSRREVCDLVNLVFSKLMTEKIGDIDYKNGEELVLGAEYPPLEQCEPELHILSYDKDYTDEKKVEIEAKYTAGLCKKMLDAGFLVTDKNKKVRPCRPEDFGVLLRKKKDNVKIFCDSLNELGIPTSSDVSEGYLGEYEIAVAINILRVIDNPLSEIALLSVLFSPIFGFCADDVAKIRLCGAQKNPKESLRKQSLYNALVEFSKGDLSGKEALDFFDEMRTRAAIMPVHELVAEIFEKTDFISLFCATTKNVSERERKAANLRLLTEYARSYEEIGSGGLSGFLRYVDKMQTSNQDLPGARLSAGVQNAVSVMSIHSSKGLEFPICIVADCSKQFNKRDINSLSYQMNSQLGFSMKISEPQSMKSYTNFSYEAIRLKREKDMLSEELRVLYVAMTRAREKLICVMTYNNARKELANAINGLVGDTVTPFEVYSAKGYSDWILTALLRHPSFNEIRKELSSKEIACEDGEVKLFTYLNDAVRSRETKLTAKEALEKECIGVDETLEKRLFKGFSYEYEYKPLTKIRAKLTVTELAKQQQLTSVNLQKAPEFMLQKDATPQKKGTLLHRFMQFADFFAAQQSLEEELSQLCQKGFFTKEEVGLLEQDKILCFLNGELCKRIQTNEHKREYKFNFFIPASSAYEDIPKEFAQTPIFVQGIADCIIFEGDKLVLVDYKTDMVTDEEILISRYKNQMLLYKNAIEQTFTKEVVECIIYSLNMSRQITI